MYGLRASDTHTSTSQFCPSHFCVDTGPKVTCFQSCMIMYNSISEFPQPPAPRAHVYCTCQPSFRSRDAIMPSLAELAPAGSRGPKRLSSFTMRCQRYALAARSVWQKRIPFSLQLGSPGPATKRSHGLAAAHGKCSKIEAVSSYSV
jgi:hypothetical protein